MIILFIGTSVNSLKYFSGPNSPAKSDSVSTVNVLTSIEFIESVACSNLIEICKKLRADSYINLPGGKNLYSFDCFESQSINLKFLDKVNETERQYSILENLFNESAKKINVSLVNK